MCLQQLQKPIDLVPSTLKPCWTIVIQSNCKICGMFGSRVYSSWLLTIFKGVCCQPLWIYYVLIIPVEALWLAIIGFIYWLMISLLVNNQLYNIFHYWADNQSGVHPLTGLTEIWPIGFFLSSKLCLLGLFSATFIYIKCSDFFCHLPCKYFASSP